MRFTATIRREGDWFVAQCLEVEVASQGHSVEEAVDNLREALELRFEGEPPPAETPWPVLVATIDVPTAQ